MFCLKKICFWSTRYRVFITLACLWGCVHCSHIFGFTITTTTFTLGLLRTYYIVEGMRTKHHVGWYWHFCISYFSSSTVESPYPEALVSEIFVNSWTWYRMVPPESNWIWPWGIWPPPNLLQLSSLRRWIAFMHSQNKSIETFIRPLFIVLMWWNHVFVY